MTRAWPVSRTGSTDVRVAQHALMQVEIVMQAVCPNDKIKSLRRAVPESDVAPPARSAQAMSSSCRTYTQCLSDRRHR
jgi:hypothetical protein